MNKYFFLTWIESDSTGVVYAPDGTPLAFELIDIVKDIDEIPFIFELRQGEMQDYIGNSLAWPIMSEKMKKTIDRNLTGEEGIKWIRVNIKAATQIYTYYLLSFKKNLDVLDKNKTIYVSGTDHIIKPVFSLEKIKQYGIFHKPDSLFGNITAAIYVGEKLKKEILKEKLSGVDFERVAVI